MKKLNMRKNTMPGVLISFCGLDGCGKTTMISRLASDLRQKYDVYLTKQPTDNVRSSAIFRTYMDCPDHSEYDYRSLSLFAASDRLQHTNKVILPMVEDGKVVISDRYFYSCLANLIARGFETDKWIYEIAESIVKPDISFFFDVPVEEAVARVRRRPEEKHRYIDMELQYKLREEYINICNKNNGILISTTQDKDKSYTIVKNAVKKILEKPSGNFYE